MATATIKVNRVALIAELEKAGDTLSKRAEAIKKAESDYQIALNKWAYGAIKHRSGDFSTDYHNRITFAVSAEYLAERPEAPKEKAEDTMDWRRGHRITRIGEINNALKEISNTIAVLKLSTEETVGQSIYKSVAQYLG